MNYLPSGWIENFGVVPWLRSWAFLFAPIFFFLRALLFLVILVRDTISQLQYPKFNNNKCRNLAADCNLVNLILAFGVFFSLFSTVHASAPGTYYIAIGQHLEIKTKALREFSVSNPDVISYTWLKGRQKILIKGKKKGHSELIIWRKRGKKTIQVFVSSKMEEMRSQRMGHELAPFGLNVEKRGEHYEVQGTIKELKVWKRVTQLRKASSGNISFVGKIAPLTYAELISEVYLLAKKHNRSDISCKAHGPEVLCEHRYALEKNFLKLGQEYPLKFQRFSRPLSNFKAHLRILSLKHQNGLEFAPGIHGINLSPIKFFRGQFTEILSNTTVSFNQSDIKISLLASSTVTLSLGNKARVQVGDEIPYIAQGEGGVVNSLWKFAGLNIELLLKDKKGELSLGYKTEVTAPGAEKRVSGNKQSSQVLIKNGKVMTLFDIGMQQKNRHVQQIPYISEIPLLGELFKRRSDSKTFVKILGLLYIEEV